MKRIAVVTSGGDAPGINAAVRAVVRTAIDKGWEAFGVRHGYAGLANDDFLPLGRRDVGGIIQRGGTMLGSKRSVCTYLLSRENRAKIALFGPFQRQLVP